MVLWTTTYNDLPSCNRPLDALARNVYDWGQSQIAHSFSPDVGYKAAAGEALGPGVLFAQNTAFVDGPGLAPSGWHAGFDARGALAATPTQGKLNPYSFSTLPFSAGVLSGVFPYTVYGSPRYIGL